MNSVQALSATFFANSSPTLLWCCRQKWFESVRTDENWLVRKGKPDGFNVQSMDNLDLFRLFSLIMHWTSLSFLVLASSWIKTILQKFSRRFSAVSLDFMCCRMKNESISSRSEQESNERESCIEFYPFLHNNRKPFISH